MNLSMTPPTKKKRRFWPLLILVLFAAVGAFFLLPPSHDEVALKDVRKVWTQADVVAPFSGTVGAVASAANGAVLPPGTAIFSYNVATLREELQAMEGHAEALAQSLPPAARALVQSPETMSTAMQEQRLGEATKLEQSSRRALEAASEGMAQSSVQAEQARIRRGRGEISQAALTQALDRREEARAQLGAAQRAFEAASLGRHAQEETLRVLVDMERSLAAESTPLYRRFSAYKAAVAATAQLQALLANPAVSLDWGGRIIAIDIRPGDPVTAGQVVAKVEVLPSPVRLTAHVDRAPEAVAVGASVRITARVQGTGDKAEVAGQVVAVSPDGTGALLDIFVSDTTAYENIFWTPEEELQVFLEPAAR